MGDRHIDSRLWPCCGKEERSGQKENHSGDPRLRKDDRRDAKAKASLSGSLGIFSFKARRTAFVLPDVT